MTATKYRNFRIPPELDSQLAKQAEKENRSLSNMIIQCVSDYLRRAQKEDDMKKSHERVLKEVHVQAME